VTGAAPGDEVGDDGPAGLSIDELAARTGVPSRTIRFYQSRGALPHPRRHGRAAVYDQSHVERLRLIAELQDRGLRLDAIRDLLGRADGQRLSVSDWLGLQDRLEAPWSDERPHLVTEAELQQLVGDRPPGTLAGLVRAGFVTRSGDTVPPAYLIRSRRLLDMAVQLLDAGIELELVAGAERTLRRRIAQASDELVALIAAEAERRLEDGSGRPEDLAAAVDALRPVASEATSIILAQEIERAIRTTLEQGGKPPARPPRSSRKHR
jgi:DNA-binding transcriptional MerR regulator